MCVCLCECVCVFELRGGKKRPLTYRSGLHTKGVFSNNLLHTWLFYCFAERVYATFAL